MSDQKLSPYGDISVVTGKYMKDGKERNRYTKIGTLFATPHFSNVSIKLDALPMNDGWLSVFPKQKQSDDTLVDVPDGPINLNDIPF